MAHPARHLEKPQEGTYATRLVKKGVRVPARISLQDGRWLLTTDGVAHDQAYTPEQVEEIMLGWLFDAGLQPHAKEFAKILAFAEPISETEYQRMLDLRAWAAANEPDHPCLHPRRPIDLTKVRSLW